MLRKKRKKFTERNKSILKKYSFEFSINSLSKIVTEAPTVDIDCGFLLGAITIIGISLA